MSEKETPIRRHHQGQKTGPIFQKNAAAFAVGLAIAAGSGFFALRAAVCTVEPVAPERINPNTAAVPSLMRLPGIGRARAMDIAAGRTAQPFDNAADLERIRGIGPKTVENIAPYLFFEKTEDRSQESGVRR